MEKTRHINAIFFSVVDKKQMIDGNMAAVT